MINLLFHQSHSNLLQASVFPCFEKLVFAEATDAKVLLFLPFLLVFPLPPFAVDVDEYIVPFAMLEILLAASDAPPIFF